MEKNMTPKKDYIPLVGIAVIIICLILSTIQINADEPTVQDQTKEELELQQKRAKQQKLEAEIEALVSTPLSNEEILGKDFIEYVNNKHKGGK